MEVARPLTRVLSVNESSWLVDDNSQVYEVQTFHKSIQSSVGLLVLCLRGSFIPKLSPLRRGEPDTFYHVCDVKGRRKVETQLNSTWVRMESHLQ